MKRTMMAWILALAIFAALSFPAALAAKYQDGFYDSQAEGMNGPLSLRTVILDDEIIKIVVEHDEMEMIGEPAIDVLIDRAIQAQSADVEIVTGATITSQAFIAALKDALAQAGGEEAEEALPEAQVIRRRTPEPTASVSAPVITFEDVRTKVNGVAYLYGSTVEMKWQSVGDVQSYHVEICNEFNTMTKSFDTSDTRYIMRWDELSDPLTYTVNVVAIPRGGTVEAGGVSGSARFARFVEPTQPPTAPPDISTNSGGMVGVSMPTEDLQRWKMDGNGIKSLLEKWGWDVDLRFAGRNADTQQSQVLAMIAAGVDVLIVAPVDGYAFGQAMQAAKDAGIPVIAYDRLLMETDCDLYYITFDIYSVGVIQGRYIIDALDLENAEGPFNLEITAGDSGNVAANYYYMGAYDVLAPYIDSGKLVVRSGQTSFVDTSTPGWNTDTAEERAASILQSYYSNGEHVDAWLCSNDTTALGVVRALDRYYSGRWPVITGQDCDCENVKNIIAGKQSMSVLSIEVMQAARMAEQLLKGETVDVNDTQSYYNGRIRVPAFLCDSIYVDKYNVKEILVDNGYYTKAELGL